MCYSFLYYMRRTLALYVVLITYLLFRIHICTFRISYFSTDLFFYLFIQTCYPHTGATMNIVIFCMRYLHLLLPFLSILCIPTFCGLSTAPFSQPRGKKNGTETILLLQSTFSASETLNWLAMQCKGDTIFQAVHKPSNYRLYLKYYQ